MGTFLQQSTGSTSVIMSKKTIARIFNITDDKVGYINNIDNIDNYLILFDKESQLCWYNTATGVPQTWTIINNTLSLTTTTGTYVLFKSNINGNGKTINFSSFGINGDGSDETTKMQQAFTFANIHGFNLISDPKKSYKISGSNNITINYSVDWNNSTIDISDFTGKFLLYRPDNLKPVTLSNTSPEIQAIITKGETLWGGVINAWATNDTLKNYYINIKTNTNAYEYRNTIYKMNQMNRLYRGGSLAHNFDYPIVPSSISSIDLYPIPDTYTEFKNAIFNKTSDPRDFITVEHTRYKISNIQLNHNGGLVSTGMIWINANLCFDLIYDNICTPFGTRYLTNPNDSSTIQASYTFRIGDSYNVQLKNLHSNGLEWGTIGTDEITNCLVENCTLARYDSHRPFHGYLKIIDCSIGARGISVQGAGSVMQLERIRFLNNSINDFTPNNGLPFFINTRGDAGGFVDCDLIINDCVFVNNLDQSINVIAETWGPSFSNGLPSGSLYQNICFRTITINNPVVQTIPNSQNSSVDFGIREAVTGTVSVTPTGTNTPDLPFKININGVNSRPNGLATFTILCTRPASTTRATNITSSVSNAYEMKTNIEINMNNCVWSEKQVPITVTDITNTYSTRMEWNSIRTYDDSQPITMRIYTPLLLNCVNSRVREIRPFYNNATLQLPMGLSFTSCDIFTNDTFISWDTTLTNHHCTISSCNIIADDTSGGLTAERKLARMAAYKLSSCNYIKKGVGKIQVPITTTLSSDTATFVDISYFTTDNIYRIELDQGSWPIIIPEPTKAIYMDLGFTEDGITPKRMKIYRSSGTGGGLVLTKFNNPLPTFIYLP